VISVAKGPEPAVGIDEELVHRVQPPSVPLGYGFGLVEAHQPRWPRALAAAVVPVFAPTPPECADSDERHLRASATRISQWARRPTERPCLRHLVGRGCDDSGCATRTRTGNLYRCMGDFRETIIYRWLAAGDAGDLDAFDDLLLPDAVIHAPRGLSTTSREAEKAVWQDALAAMPDLRHDVQEVLVGRDIEMARVVVTGTMAAAFAGVEGSGRYFQMDQAVIAHLRDGRIEEAWEIADVAAVERQTTGAGQADAN